MKKLYFLPLLLVAATLFAEDASLVENFRGVGNVATGTYTWTGDLCQWSAFQTARRKQDTIHTANQTQAIWMSVSQSGAAKVSTIDWEGGIKAVAFKYARFGSEKSPAGRVLQLKVTVGETENSTPTFAGNAMKVGNGATAAHESYSYAFNAKNEAQLSIENISAYEEELTASGICRICVGDITITPYLRYTTKSAIFNLKDGSFTNSGLINNTDGEGAIVYSISENTIGAAVDAATGAVTAEQPGEVTVTATWEGISTSYTLRIVPENFRIETFDNAEETAHTYATSEESTQGDVCSWYAYLGGIKSMTDAAYLPIFPTKYACFRAPYDNAMDVPYIKSSTIEGGIKYLKFQCNPTASEAATTWDIRVFINDQQVGETSYGGFGAAPQAAFTTVTIPDINIKGNFVIRFENHSTIDGGYTSGNKGRIAIDNIEWEGYCAGEYGIKVDGETYIAGKYNEEKNEYKIVAELDKGQTFVIYDDCVQAGFMANQEEGGYWFHYTNDNHDAFKAPATGKYTIYLKMYGPGDNWIWTAFEMATGMSGSAIKADVRKVVENGTVVIYRNGVRYNLQGKEL